VFEIQIGKFLAGSRRSFSKPGANVGTQPLESLKMGCSTRVVNITNGRHLKRSQARGRVEQCLSAWVEEGYTIRDLTLQETIAARNKREPIPFSEIPRLRFEDPYLHKESGLMTREATQFGKGNYCFLPIAKESA
jgi:hypothetical protein